MPTGDPPVEPVTSGKAKFSLVFGILAIVCVGLNFLPAFLGLILGFLGVRDVGRSNGAVGGKGLAITGIVLSCLGFVCNCISLGAGVPLGFAFVEKGKQDQARKNLKYLGIAMHNYAATYQDKLASAVADGQKRPILSHRVLLLPYVEEDALYRDMDLKQPWDGPKNKALLSRRPKYYADATNPMPPDASNYRFFVGPNTLYPQPGYQTLYTIANIPDGTSNTILSVSATDGVPWSKPEELSNTPGIASKLGPPGRDFFIVGMCDGSVRIVKKTISDTTLKNAIDPADGGVLGADW